MGNDECFLFRKLVARDYVSIDYYATTHLEFDVVVRTHFYLLKHYDVSNPYPS